MTGNGTETGLPGALSYLNIEIAEEYLEGVKQNLQLFYHHASIMEQSVRTDDPVAEYIIP